MIQRRSDDRSEFVAARARRIRARRRIAVVRPVYPAASEMSYARDLLELLRLAKAMVKARIEPVLAQIFRESQALVRADDEFAEAVAVAFDEVEVEYEKLIRKRRRAVARKAGRTTARSNAKESARVIEAKYKSKGRQLVGLEVLQSEQWMVPLVELFTRDNVALIESIPKRYFAEIEDIVRTAALSGRRPENLAELFEERYGVSESRARLLARDQVGKFNGELTRVRHGKLGITEYVWCSSQDERVRESHRSKEGRVFSYDDPPADTGAPGMDYQCRCTASPVIPGIDDDE